MKILFFDTETTGFNPPAILQIGIVIGDYTDSGEVIREEKVNLLFDPRETIDEQASKVHGITQDIIVGKPTFSTFSKIFIKNVECVDYVIGHNVDFDIKAIEWELNRIYKELGKEDEGVKVILEFISKMRNKSICTMQNSIDLLKLPGKYNSYKWPKLNELYEHLFNKGFENAHDAMADIEATRDCFFELLKRNILKLK